MKKFAVRVLKNAYHPLNVPESIDLEDGQMILVRTEKGEEVFKAFLVNSEISKFWEKLKPETLTVIRTLSQRDIQTLEEIRHEEVTSFFKCQERDIHHISTRRSFEFKHFLKNRKSAV